MQKKKLNIWMYVRHVIWFWWLPKQLKSNLSCWVLVFYFFSSSIHPSIQPAIYSEQWRRKRPKIREMRRRTNWSKKSHININQAILFLFSFVYLISCVKAYRWDGLIVINWVKFFIIYPTVDIKYILYINRNESI